MPGELMEGEIREQPSLLAENAASYLSSATAAVRGKSFDMVLLVARGSSDNAALVARYWIEVFLGIPVSLAAPSVLTRFGRSVKYPPCLAVGISQSGAAPDVSEVLGALRADGHLTIGLTNTPGSRLTEEAECSILFDAGAERSVAATKTYTASLLALYQLVTALGADLPSASGNLPGQDWLSYTHEAAQQDARVLQKANPQFALGRGFSFGTALETSLKLMECALLPCKAYSIADFEHGPKALAGKGSVAVSFEGPLPNLSEQGCEILSAPSSNQPEPIRPIWDALYSQWLALQCARMRNLNPDDPQHLQKVTRTL
jgi:glucosamine--fructose-6-phosphate aminotransferase (isomerizing)